MSVESPQFRARRLRRVVRDSRVARWNAPLGDCAPHRAVPQALMALSRVVEQSDRP
jgi:hypothetical protein